MTRKPPRTGLLMLFVAIGTGTVGFVVGFVTGSETSASPPSRSDLRHAALPGLPPAAEAPDEAWLDDDGSYAGASAAAAAQGDRRPDGVDGPLGPPPSELIGSLRRHASSDRGQKILAGMIADAARVGGPMLPELQRLLASGEDIKFSGYDAKKGGYPSLRTALLAAAEATGDPEAKALIAEVAQTTESPIEVVFSANLLDRMEALDAPTAQRTLDSLVGPLTDEQRKAMGPMVGRVVPAAAAVDPAYAENLLTAHLRGQDPKAARMLMPALNGLPPERAKNIVLTSMTASDVDDRAKRWLAGQAARRPELGMLTALRRAIETNTVSPRVAASVAYSSMSGRPYSTLAKQARKAAKQGDLGKARNLSVQFQQRLNEAQKTVTAAQAAGAKIKPKLFTTAKSHRQTLDELRQYIKQLQAKRAAAKAKGGRDPRIR